MRLRVKGIGRSGERYALKLSEEWVREAAAEGFEAPATELEGSLDVSAPIDAGRVDVRCVLKASAVRPCDRCSEDVTLHVDVDTLLLYFPEGGVMEATGEIELDCADLDVGWYTGGFLDLKDVVREGVVLMLSQRVACEDSVACDTRTRKMLDDCADPDGSVHPAFAVLKDLR